MSSTVLRQDELLRIVLAYQDGVFEELLPHFGAWKRFKNANQRAAWLLLHYAGLHWLQRLLACWPIADSVVLMDMAASHGQLELVRYLSVHGASGCTAYAMDAAARNGHDDVVQFLHATRSEGCLRYTLDHAAMNGHLSIVRFLHDHRHDGCSTNAVDYAARNGHINVVAFLLQGRHEGCTHLALTFAAQNGHLDVVAYLVQHASMACILIAIPAARAHGHHDVATYFTLDTSRFALARLRDASSDALDALLLAVQARSIEVVLSPRLWGLFQHFSTLGSDRLKALRVAEIHALDSHVGSEHSAGSALVFIVQPLVAQVYLVARRIASVVEHQPKGAPPLVVHILHAGPWNALCATVLAQERTADVVQLTLALFPLGFIPLDSDVLTMGSDTLLRECYLGSNKTSLATMAHALYQLEVTLGKIDHIFYKGNLAHALWKHLASLHIQNGVPPPAKSKKHRIDCLMVFDRKLDYFAPLSTPLTQAASASCVLAYRDGMVQVDANLLDDTIPSGQQQAPMSLSSDDAVFELCRNVHIQALGPLLQHQVAAISEEHAALQKAMHDEAAWKTDISNLPGQVQAHLHQQSLLNQHLQLSQLLQATTNSKDFRRRWLLERAIMEGEPRLGDIEQLIWKQGPLLHVLRLLALHSLVNHGIPRELYFHLKTQIMQFYGYEYLHTFENLEQVGLLRMQDQAQKAAPNLLRAFGCIGNYGGDVVHPDDAGYVSGGYTPLLVKLVDAALGPSQWEPMAELLHQLPGPSAHFSTSDADKPRKKTKFKTVLVVVVGGLTWLEIAALRFLGQQRNVAFLFASNAIASGQRFVDPLLEAVYNGLLDQDIK
ncbi:hypothetical protein SPRG_00579 [Saprolegnia parasitica CBS 223.65]|uniref:Uncharacterized protein n=1 Tax=Saprolegnia parasitica (strain CBS 223.65) TaxID=695850 RepID=A0A067D755_SAPPC|nr:hypothetical protein SPRG_00579 [Saprolegnia parasitica CBS 223.65]KDO34516.1 hypothetical protein SPRG_00579 [Saprolegnia parasitica CBS 223.65]|eukprot:XP_012194194.1 hypothetical protein SPRG_00579 [Saprolegnia parasitica CBS 223.65]